MTLSMVGSPISTVLVGVGNSGQHYHRPHLEARDDFDLIAIARASPISPSHASMTNRHDLHVYSGWQEAVALPEAELVVLALPHHLHYAAARAALVAGKHVLVEKPMTMTVEEAHELSELASMKSLVLATHHQRRFEADFVALRRLVRDGELGVPWRFVVTRSHQGRYLESTVEAPHVGGRAVQWAHSPDSGGGVMRVIAPHSVDHLLRLADEPVRAVSARAHIDKFDGVDDWVGIDVTFESGATGTVEAFRRSIAPPPRFNIYGTAGAAIADHGCIRVVKDEDHVIEGFTPPGRLGGEIYDDLFQTIRHGRTPRVTVLDAIAVVDVIERAERSLCEQGLLPKR